jgi:integrase
MTAMSTNTSNLPMPPATPAPLTGDQAAQLIALLQAAQAGTPAMGTGGALVPGDPITVRDLVGKALVKLEDTSSKRTYGTYLRLLRDGLAGPDPEKETYAGLGDRYWHEVLVSDLQKALEHVKARALATGKRQDEARAAVDRTVRKSDASGAVFNAVGAWRYLGQVAIDDRHLATGYCPAQRLKKPKRSKGGRTRLHPALLEQLRQFTASTGDDPELDDLIVTTILVSGARQEGLLNLTLSDLDQEECTIRLDEKFGKVVHQPVPDWLVRRLEDFARSRGASRYDDKVFIKRPIGRRPAKPITPRRFNYIAGRIQAAFPWADKLGISGHALRHEAIKRVERVSSKAVAVAFARHEPGDTNDVYSKASREEVAAAVILLNGGDHPWLHRAPRLPE